MKASKIKGANQIELSGILVGKIYAIGTKSEHNAVFIETTEGAFKLRRVGGNPFNDPVLIKLIGKKITAIGRLNDSTFFAITIKLIS